MSIPSSSDDIINRIAKGELNFVKESKLNSSHDNKANINDKNSVSISNSGKVKNTKISLEPSNKKIFEKCVFFVEVYIFDLDKSSIYYESIVKNGGEISKTLDNKVTHILFNDGKLKTVGKALELKKQLLNPVYVDDCINSNTLITDLSPYKVNVSYSEMLIDKMERNKVRFSEIEKSTKNIDISQNPAVVNKSQKIYQNIKDVLGKTETDVKQKKKKSYDNALKKENVNVNNNVLADKANSKITNFFNRPANNQKSKQRKLSNESKKSKNSKNSKVSKGNLSKIKINVNENGRIFNLLKNSKTNKDNNNNNNNNKNVDSKHNGKVSIINEYENENVNLDSNTKRSNKKRLSLLNSNKISDKKDIDSKQVEEVFSKYDTKNRPKYSVLDEESIVDRLDDALLNKITDEIQTQIVPQSQINSALNTKFIDSIDTNVDSININSIDQFNDNNECKTTDNTDIYNKYNGIHTKNNLKEKTYMTNNRVSQSHTHYKMNNYNSNEMLNTDIYKGIENKENFNTNIKMSQIPQNRNLPMSYMKVQSNKKLENTIISLKKMYDYNKYNSKNKIIYNAKIKYDIPNQEEGKTTESILDGLNNCSAYNWIKTSKNQQSQLSNNLSKSNNFDNKSKKLLSNILNTKKVSSNNVSKSKSKSQMKYNEYNEYNKSKVSLIELQNSEEDLNSTELDINS